MKPILIIKAGTTFPATRQQLGDFDQWTTDALALPAPAITVHDPVQDKALPDSMAYSGVVITGAHAMVTDPLPWIARLESWLRTLLRQQAPIFGICFGHQLLAQAAGGEVGFHPQGKEISTVTIELTDASAEDPLFHRLPTTFPAHVTHAQSVFHLPKGATLLARNGHEPHQAFRLGDSAWGVQFHPEFSPEIMRAYIREQETELKTIGMETSTLLDRVSETEAARQLLQRFGHWASNRAE